jgi:hypothetical protein
MADKADGGESDGRSSMEPENQLSVGAEVASRHEIEAARHSNLGLECNSCHQSAEVQRRF